MRQNRFSERSQKDITDSFLQGSVLNSLGWGEEIDTKTNQKIDTDSLNGKIKDYAKIDFKDGIFYAKDSAKLVEENRSKVGSGIFK